MAQEASYSLDISCLKSQTWAFQIFKMKHYSCELHDELLYDKVRLNQCKLIKCSIVIVLIWNVVIFRIDFGNVMITFLWTTMLVSVFRICHIASQRGSIFKNSWPPRNLTIKLSQTFSGFQSDLHSLMNGNGKNVRHLLFGDTSSYYCMT